MRWIIILVLVAIAVAMASASTTYYFFRHDKQPTASELFNLRSKCAELGRKMIDPDLSSPRSSQHQLSRYDQIANRCYVSMFIETDLGASNGGATGHYLYDGQTDEVLGGVDGFDQDKAESKRDER